MNSPLHRRVFCCFTSLALVAALLFPSVISAQKGRTKTAKDELTILKKLPDFFINDAFLPAKLKGVYRRDAARLAIRLIDKEQRASAQTVEIPEQLVQALYNALVAVRVSQLPVVDTICEKYNVRTWLDPNVNFVTLVFEHDAEWARPLKMRADTTGSPTLNRIMRNYNLSVNKLIYIDEERSGLVLYSKEPINIQALSKKFFVEEGIACIEEMQTYGDGNDIEVALNEEGGWDMTYSVKFGQCITTCTKRYDWKFKVSKGGTVSFVEQGGDTIPPWVSSGKARVAVPDKLNTAKSGGSYIDQDKKTQDKVRKEND